MSIGMSPFKALYSYDALTFVDLVFGDSRDPKARDWIQENQNILKALKNNLQTAQNQQKLYTERHRIERSFKVGDLVYLRLQPYRQSSLKKKGTEKLNFVSTDHTGSLERYERWLMSWSYPKGVRFRMPSMCRALRKL